MGGQLDGPRLAEHLARRVEQDRERVRPAERAECGRHGFRAEHHPRSPAIGRVVDRPMTAQAPVPQVVDPDGGETPFLDAARDARGKRALDHCREEREDVDLEGHQDGSVRRRLRPGRSLVRPTAGSAQSVFRCPALGRHPEVQGLGVDHDLAAARGEDADEVADRREIERPERPAGHLEHLGLGHAIHIAHGPELRAVDAPDRGPDDLVPVVLAAAELADGIDDRLEIRVAQRVRRVRSGISRNRTRQPGPSATGSAETIVSGSS